MRRRPEDVYKRQLHDAMKHVSALSTAELLDARFTRLMAYGRTKEQPLH